MNVAQVLGYLAARYGGPPQVAIQLGYGLQELGVNNTWWATATEKERDEFVNMGNKVNLFLTTFPQFWYRSPQLYSSLAKQVPTLDILHLHQVWDYPLFAAARLAKKENKPYLVTPHGIFSQPWRYSNSFHKRVYLKFIAKRLIQDASCIHAITPSEVAGLKKLGFTNPIAVIPNGISPSDFGNLPHPKNANENWPVLKDRLVVLFLGRLSKEKGLDLLLKSWKKVVREFPQALLMLAGPDFNNFRTDLELIIQKEQIGSYVFFSGMLKKQDKLTALSRADIYIQPSYSEGFSVAILEALACGKPCIITTGCNFPKLERIQAGKIIEPRSSELTETLIYFLSLSDDERNNMGYSGREYVINNLTWEKIAKKMLMVYTKILNKDRIQGVIQF